MTYEAEFIPNKEKFAHCSSIVELPNGNLLVSFYAGTAEARSDTKVYTCLFNQSKGIWEEPCVVIDTPGKSNGNAVLFLNKNNRLYLFNNTIHREWRKFPRLWNWALTDNRVMHSDDFGKTWSKNMPLFPEKIGLNFKNKAIYLNNGTILCSIYDDLYFKSYILISKDEGQTWQLSNPIETIPKPTGVKKNFYKLINKVVPLFGNIQPSLIEKFDGEIMAFLRPKNFKRILFSISKDGGINWTKTKETDIKNPQSGIDVVKLSNGNLALAYNDSETSRSILNIALSENNGEDWTYKKTIQNGPLKEYSYPALIQDSKGLIHLTYTYARKCIKHIKFSEDWIKS